MEKKFNVRVLAEIAIFAALGFALDALQGGYSRGLFPSGGSIGFAMLPIFIIGYRRGFVPGILCGLVLSLVQMLSGIYVISGASYDNGFIKAMAPFFQVLLDYVFAYTLVGVCGAFSGLYHKKSDFKGQVLFIIIGCVVGGLLKYSSHVIAGGLFYLDPSKSFLGVQGDSWWFSFVYNGAYNIPNIIICTAVMVIIAKFYPQLLNAEEKAVVNENEEEKGDAADER